MRFYLAGKNAEGVKSYVVSYSEIDSVTYPAMLGGSVEQAAVVDTMFGACPAKLCRMATAAYGFKFFVVPVAKQIGKEEFVQRRRAIEGRILANYSAGMKDAYGSLWIKAFINATKLAMSAIPACMSEDTLSDYRLTLSTLIKTNIDRFYSKRLPTAV